jgi:hypothetical protein
MIACAVYGLRLFVFAAMPWLLGARRGQLSR